MGDAASIMIYLPPEVVDLELEQWLNVLRDRGFIETDWCELNRADGARATYGPCAPLNRERQ